MKYVLKWITFEWYIFEKPYRNNKVNASIFQNCFLRECLFLPEHLCLNISPVLFTNFFLEILELMTSAWIFQKMKWFKKCAFLEENLKGQIKYPVQSASIIFLMKQVREIPIITWKKRTLLFLYRFKFYQCAQISEGIPVVQIRLTTEDIKKMRTTLKT